MLKKSLDKILDKPLISAVSAIIIWASVTNIMFFLGDRLIDNLLFQIMSFMVVYPLGTLCLCFFYSKHNGLKWYFFVLMGLIVTAEYFFVSGFDSIIPNIIICTLLCMVFGGGIGNCFADKDEINARKTLKMQNKNHEDEPYKKILDD